ncbi:MAG TPA: DUF427 domain-containing protein [Polyangiales bacterium]|nr:DUF427 domain-containing protein [Polyangiales bacterium]
MSLTTGRAPLGPNPAGRFDKPVPAGAVYVEPFLRRVRAVVGLRTVIDSDRVVLVHRAGLPPTYAFPEDDVRDLPATPEPAAEGYVRVPWNAVTAWYEEEEEVFGGHPRNPYHRLDCVRARRRLRAEVPGAVLVDTADVIALYETSRSPQLYVRREAVRMDLLVPSRTFTYCPYKGTASHWTVEVDGKLVHDVAWSYDDPLPECAPIAGMLSFYPERLTMRQEVQAWFQVPPARSHG